MFRAILQFLAALALTVAAAADQIELAEGSVLMGKILSVESGKISIATSFAGTLSIDLNTVRSFATTEPVNVAVAGSPVVHGHVYASPNGVQLQSDTLRLVAAPAQVTTLWRDGGESPIEKLARLETEKARRKWSYEATAAITGRTGAREKLNAALGGKATLASERERLVLAAQLERAQDNGVATADREFVGADYSSFYSADHGWYARTSLESDQIKELDVRSTTAFGFSRKLVRRAHLDLEARLGASYIYQLQTDDTEFASPGLDFTILNTWTVGGAKLNTAIAYMPTFRDTDQYRIRHESALEVPLSVSMWKLKVGIGNEYQNVPPEGVDRFDTTYFTSLLLSWK
jgi:hypothetical protein